MENRKPAKSFRDLIVWQKAHELVLDVYKVTKDFPKEEVYALTSQMRRSSMSVAANIAEGFKKKSNLDKIRILNIAQGSLSETEYFLMLASDLKYSDMANQQALADQVGRLLESYVKAIKG
ncbi:MAG TPA: four helix bundle protein [Cyclobacteriaceae bacterium]|nr:four helix bundle protein [Cyclobacteriaceae bacterium]